MKKINTLMKNENVMATIIVGGIFLLTGVATFLAIYFG